jgi:hypothetical protein
VSFTLILYWLNAKCGFLAVYPGFHHLLSWCIPWWDSNKFSGYLFSSGFCTDNLASTL